MCGRSDARNGIGIELSVEPPGRMPPWHTESPTLDPVPVEHIRCDPPDMSARAIRVVVGIRAHTDAFGRIERHGAGNDPSVPVVDVHFGLDLDAHVGRNEARTGPEELIDLVRR